MAGIPRYEVRAGFIASDWTEIGTKYTWPMIADAFRWEELAAGPMPDVDVEEINCSRRVASIFERLETADLRVQVSNNRGQYTSIGNLENRLPWSFDMTSPNYLVQGATWVVNQGTFIDGSLSAGKLVDDVSSGPHSLRMNTVALAIDSSQTYCLSGYFKDPGGEISRFNFRIADQNESAVVDANFSVNSLTLTGPTGIAGATAAGASLQLIGNGWVRVWVSGIMPSSVTNVRARCYLINSGGNIFYPGTSLGILTSGWQLNVGTLPLVYSQTNGVPFAVNGYDPHINDVLCVKAIDASSVYSVFSGYLERWDADPSLVNLQKTVLAGTDVANRLRPIISTSLMAGVAHRDIITAIMSAASIPPEQYLVDLNGLSDIAPFAYEDQVSAGDAIAEVQSAGGHYCFVDGRGRIQLKGRNFDVGTLTAVASYTNFFSYAIAREQDEIINRAEVQSKPRDVYPGVTTVGWISDAIFIPIGTTKQFLLDYVDPITQETGVPVFNPQQPVNSVDIKMNANPDGNGVDYSASCSATVILNATAALFTVSNNGTDGSNAYLSVCQVIGRPVTRLPDLSQTERDLPSIAQYGERYGSIDSDLIGTANRARNLAQYMIVTLSQPSTTVQAALKNEWPDVFQRELLDRIAVVNSKTAVSSMFYVREIEDTITFDGGTQHVCDMRLRLAFQKWWFTLNSSTLGRLNYNQLGF